MLEIATRKKALVANTILINVSEQYSVAPPLLTEGFSPGGPHSIDQVLPFTSLFDANEGAVQFYWRRVRESSLHTRDDLVGRLALDAIDADVLPPTWVSALYDASLRSVSDDDIVAMFDALEIAIYGDIDRLDAALAMIDTKRLAPDFVVGIPRALFPLRDHLFNWRPFVLRAWSDLASRTGLDVRELLQGLL
jgi:hypothetical protein